jgi:tetratricopeptide (TPR) repeat protein
VKTINVGRSSDNDIALNDKEASRHHAQFRQETNGEITVSDLNSLNGTKVNGKAIKVRTTLIPGDEVKIGNTILSWETYFSKPDKSIHWIWFVVGIVAIALGTLILINYLSLRKHDVSDVQSVVTVVVDDETQEEVFEVERIEPKPRRGKDSKPNENSEKTPNENNELPSDPSKSEAEIKKEECNKLFNDGKIAFDAKRFEVAINEFEKALQQNCDNSNELRNWIKRCKDSIDARNICPEQPAPPQPPTDFVILQTSNGRIAVQKTDASASRLPYPSAKRLCENSTVGGYSNWRMPTLGELATIYSAKNIIGGFTRRDNNYYWSTSGYRQVIHFNTGKTSSNELKNSYVRCVRTMP